MSFRPSPEERPLLAALETCMAVHPTQVTAPCPQLLGRGSAPATPTSCFCCCSGARSLGPSSSFWLSGSSFPRVPRTLSVASSFVFSSAT